MSVRQLSIVIDKKFRARLKIHADRRGVTVSQLVRSILSEGLEKISGVSVTVDKTILEEIFMTIFGLEEMAVRGLVDKFQSMKTDDATRMKIFESIDQNARTKTKKMLKGR